VAGRRVAARESVTMFGVRQRRRHYRSIEGEGGDDRWKLVWTSGARALKLGAGHLVVQKIRCPNLRKVAGLSRFTRVISKLGRRAG